MRTDSKLSRIPTRSMNWLGLFCALGILTLAASFAPRSMFADGPGIDCWSLYDGCCKCKAGKVGSGGGDEYFAAQTSTFGGEEGTYSCEKGQPTGHHLCENDGVDGVCGHSGAVCGLD